ncbi:MAG: acyl-CoA dehydrogenase [Hyphomicrobiaceae bacterium]
MTVLDPTHLRFTLDEVLALADVLALPAFAAHDRESVDQILATAEALATERFLPSYRLLDDNEPRMENGRVVLPGEIAAALDAFRDAGFYGMTAEPEHGGLGLPRTVANAAFLWFQAANVSSANYALLTMSAAELLAQHGSAEQQRRYMLPMLEGRFQGTMALSEPQAGSSLGDITTTARPLPDGRYALRGTKMWISGGEHDMSENIVHLMLARIEGAPKGVKGISLFIVPRKRLDAEGRPGVWNNVALAGLNHKMGQRGTVNTVLNISEGGETIGEIVGGPGQGLACMFTMMNEARVGVSMGAVAHASAGFLYSLAYARERVQGRPAEQKDPAAPQVALVQHADVRRMLLQQKAAVEGGMALGLYLASLGDIKKGGVTQDARTDAGLLLDFLTPVFKAWVSEESLAANWNAIQILGGAGYTRDHPLEQHYRDNRLNPIHEGTNGIQALDLVGRKAVMADGRALSLFLAACRETTRQAGAVQGWNEGPEFARRLEAALELIEQAFATIAARRVSDGATVALARAGHVMALVGLTAFGWVWLRLGLAAVRAQEGDGAGGYSAEFLAGKLHSCRHVLRERLPEGQHLLDLIVAEGDCALSMRDEWLG